MAKQKKLLDKKNKNTWWYVSNEGMMINKSDVGLTELWAQGVHDSIELTYHAYVAYGDRMFLEAIKSCWKESVGLFGQIVYNPQRYPISYPSMKPMSRDHVIYSIMAFLHGIKLGHMRKSELDFYIKHLNPFIGKTIGTTMNLKLFAWLLAIRKPSYAWLYSIVEMISSVSKFVRNVVQNTLLNIDHRFEFHQSEYQKYNKLNNSQALYNLTRKLMSKYELTYVQKLTANMISAVKSNCFLLVARQAVLSNSSRLNYVIRLLLKDKLSEEELVDAKNYLPMIGDRWSNLLNPLLTKNNLSIITDFPTDVNSVDKDYLNKLIELNND